MGVYKKAVITEAGEALAARAVSGEVTIQFSHAGTSSYAYSSSGTQYQSFNNDRGRGEKNRTHDVSIANSTVYPGGHGGHLHFIRH